MEVRQKVDIGKVTSDSRRTMYKLPKQWRSLYYKATLEHSLDGTINKVTGYYARIYDANFK